MHKTPATEGLEKLPLTEDEKNLLTDIYWIRLRLLVCSTAILLLLAVLTSFRGMNDRTFARHGQGTTDSSGDYRLSSTQIFILGVSLLGGIVLIFGAAVYTKRIVCFKKDLRDGYKYAVYKTILAREYFPITNQYFVRLDDAAYMHHEIDAGMYNQLREGQLFPVYFAMHSHYAFNRRGSFTVL